MDKEDTYDYIQELRSLATVTRWNLNDLSNSWNNIKRVPGVSFTRFEKFSIAAQRMGCSDLFLLSVAIKQLVKTT